MKTLYDIKYSEVCCIYHNFVSEYDLLCNVEKRFVVFREGRTDILSCFSVSRWDLMK